MRGWRNLGVVETIYEEEHEESSSSSPCLTPVTITGSYSSLQIRVDSWTEATGFEPDVLLHVHGRCFHLHKDPLLSRSFYLKRQLRETSEITVPLPSKITAETFAAAAAFCYGSNIIVTPFNIAPLRIAAEFLEMTEDCRAVNGNLRKKTENFFCRAVAVNQEYASVVLRSCLALLPEAEETAFLASRCIEALVSTEGIDGVSRSRWVDVVASLTADEFQMIAESMGRRSVRNHDLLYKVVDVYLKEHTGPLAEEKKNQICSAIDCNKLSQSLLIHAVQNHQMPLRFIIQAMLVEQLNTRRSFIAVAKAEHAPKPPNQGVTLGAILQRDAALRHVAQLKASMEATGEKIRSLESDLMGMKKRLQDSEERREVVEAGRSASFRFSWEDKKVGRASQVSNYSGKSSKDNTNNRKSFSQKLVKGLRNVFRKSLTSSRPENERPGLEGEEGDGTQDRHRDRDGDDFDQQRHPSHCRSHSFT